MADLINYVLAQKGVNVDATDVHMDDAEVREAQNVIHDPLGAMGGVRNRPGLDNFNSSAAAGSILGGIGVPLPNHRTGDQFFFIGRGPV